jgi:hypothetical protein
MDNDNNSTANILADLHQVEPSPVAPHANQRFTPSTSSTYTANQRPVTSSVTQPIQLMVLLSSPSEIDAYSALKATFEKKRKRSEDKRSEDNMISSGSASLPNGAPEEQIRRTPETIVNSAPAEDRLQAVCDKNNQRQREYRQRQRTAPLTPEDEERLRL